MDVEWNFNGFLAAGLGESLEFHVFEEVDGGSLNENFMRLLHGFLGSVSFCSKSFAFLGR
jgi:hypothetical protein